MLLKKILRLKKKTDSIRDTILYANNFLKTCVNNEKEIGFLKNKITVLENKIVLQEKSSKSNAGRLDEAMLSVSTLEEYKETCTRDIPILASAITEVYNIVNYALEGKLLKHAESDLNEIDSLYGYDVLEEETDDKKKKKIYH